MSDLLFASLIIFSYIQELVILGRGDFKNYAYPSRIENVHSLYLEFYQLFFMLDYIMPNQFLLVTAKEFNIIHFRYFYL